MAGASHGHPVHVMSADDEANLVKADNLWKKMKSINKLSTEDAFIHMLRIIKVAELLHQIDREDKKGTVDVFCCGVTESSTVIGANFRARQHLAAEAVNQTLCQNVGAFDDLCSRLEKAAQVPTPPLDRQLQSCAEHAVYEKLDRRTERSTYTYAVKKVKTKKAIRDKTPPEFKVVKRCLNCIASGGIADTSEPFGITPRLGKVVTDHESLVDLPVPVTDVHVMAFIRDIIRGSFKTNLPQAIHKSFPYVRVWQNINMDGEHRVLPLEYKKDDHDLNGLFH